MKRILLSLFLFGIFQFGFSQVGINTTSPNAQLDIRSGNQLTPSNTDGILIPKIDAFPLVNPTAAQQGMMVYLTTTSAGKLPGFYYWDNTGTPQWKGFGSDFGWSLTGNSGTNPTINFLGTKDDNDVVFKRNNVISGKIATYSTSFGNEALFSNTIGDYNTAIGSQALYNNTDGHHNMAFGNGALSSNTNGSHNVAFGFSALNQNSNGLYNVAMGSIALSKNVAGISNTAIGAEALREVTGSNNTALGFDAGVNTTTGNNNIAIGANTNVPNIAGNNQMSIGNVIYGADMSTTALGKVGIGVPVPTEKLEIAGKTKTTDLQVITGAGNGKVLTSDAVGNATWQNAASTADADFYEVGTTTPPDAITDNMFHTGYVGIGNNNPTYKLDVDETASGKIYAMRVKHSNPVDGGISSGIQSTISGASISSGVVQGFSTVVTPGATTAATGLRNLMGGTSNLDVSGVVNSISADGSGARTGVSNSISGTGTGITYGMYNSFSNPNASAYLGVRSNMLTAGTGYKTGLANVISNSTGGFHIGISNTFTNNNGALEETGVFSQFTGSSTGNVRGIYNEITNSGSGNVHYGVYNNINGSGGLKRYGVENILSGTATGEQFGVENDISVSGGNSTHYGVRNYLSGTGTGEHIGTYNWNAGSGAGAQYGVKNFINNSGNGVQYGVANNITNTGTGDKYGIYNYIAETATNGLHYGVYSDVAKATGYSGYFLGRFSIGTTTANNYILPLSRGTINQIMQTDATGNVTWVSPSALASGTLDQAYDFGGAGLGRTITADTGAVTIGGTDGLLCTGTYLSGAAPPAGYGIRMFWYPKKAAFRAGGAPTTEWDDASIGNLSIGLGWGTQASGGNSVATGVLTLASGTASTAMGDHCYATGNQSVAFGYGNTASGLQSTSFGSGSNASGDRAVAFGSYNYATTANSLVTGTSNTALSFGETVLGIGATSYTPTASGTTQFRATNASDRLLVVGNAIDTNANGAVDTAERSDALVILKNGNTGVGNSTPALARLQVQGAVGNTVAMFSGSANSQGVSVVSDWPGIYFNSYYSGGVRSMSGSGFTSIVNTDQSTGGFIFQTTNVANPAAGSLVGTIPTRMTIMGSGNVGIGTTTPNGQFELSLDQGRKPGTGSWTVTSDERLKTIHGNYSKGLEEIIKLQPITYNYKNTGKRTFEEKTLQKEFSGFSAQAVQKIFPEAVGVDDDGFLNFNMHPILVASVNAFKELDAKNKALQIQLEQIKTQQEEINSLKAINEEILKRLEKLENK